MWFPKALLRLVDALSSLPGVGERSAERLSFYLLEHRETLRALKEALEGAEGLTFCSRCGVITDQDPCPICSDSRRESKIVVVERPADVFLIEELGFYNGRYHVLGGLISPIEGIGPENLRIEELLRRVEEEKPDEVIFALSPTVEGDATAYYIAEKLRGKVKLSAIARGLPVGADFSLADPVTLRDAFEARKEIE